VLSSKSANRIQQKENETKFEPHTTHSRKMSIVVHSDSERCFVPGSLPRIFENLRIQSNLVGFTVRAPEETSTHSIILLACANKNNGQTQYKNGFAIVDYHLPTNDITSILLLLHAPSLCMSMSHTALSIRFLSNVIPQVPQ